MFRSVTNTVPTLLFALPLALIIALVVATASVKVLREYERAVVFTLGRYQGTKGPGLVPIDILKRFMDIMQRANKTAGAAISPPVLLPNGHDLGVAAGSFAGPVGALSGSGEVVRRRASPRSGHRPRRRHLHEALVIGSQHSDQRCSGAKA